MAPRAQWSKIYTQNIESTDSTRTESVRVESSFRFAAFLSMEVAADLALHTDSISLLTAPAPIRRRANTYTILHMVSHAANLGPPRLERYPDYNVRVKIRWVFLPKWLWDSGSPTPLPFFNFKTPNGVTGTGLNKSIAPVGNGDTGPVPDRYRTDTGPVPDSTKA